MDDIHTTSNSCNSVAALAALRPRLELAAEGGWYCIRGNHGWLCGDRRQVLAAFDELERIERRERA
jgi:hypothetical protein